MTFERIVSTLLLILLLLLGPADQLALAEETPSVGASGSPPASGHGSSDSGTADKNAKLGSQAAKASGTPAPSAPSNPTLQKLEQLSTAVDEATLLKELTEGELSKLTPDEISNQSEPLKTKLTQLSSALKKTPEELAKFWKENKTRIGDTAEGRSMRAVLDQRMKDFPGLEEIHSKTGGAREERYQQLNQLKAKLNDPSVMKDPNKRNAAISELSQMVSATQTKERNKLQSEITAKLGDTKILGEERRLLQGIDMALKMERGSVLDSTSGLKKVDGQVIAGLQNHPFIKDGSDEVKATLLGEFETSRNEEQIRVQKYWDAVAIMKNTESHSEKVRTDAEVLVKEYGDTTSWHARQFVLSGGDGAYRDGLVASAKASGILDYKEQLHSMTTNHIAGANPIGGLNGLRDDGRGPVHQIINTSDPAVLNAYLKSRGEQNDGGAYHTEEARQALVDYQKLDTVVTQEEVSVELKKEAFAEEIQEIATERALKSLGMSVVPPSSEHADFDIFTARLNTEKEKIANSQTKQVEVDGSGALQWRPYNYQIPDPLPGPQTGNAVAVVPSTSAIPKLKSDTEQIAAPKNRSKGVSLDKASDQITENPPLLRQFDVGGIKIDYHVQRNTLKPDDTSLNPTTKNPPVKKEFNLGGIKIEYNVVY